MKKSIIALLLLSMLFSCKKDQPKQYSTWYVNGQKFTTNEVLMQEGQDYADLWSVGKNNTFYLSFNTDNLPTSGDFPTNCYSSNTTRCCIRIIYTKGYRSSSNSFIHANLINNKIQYTLDSTWFYVDQGQDSVLVKGVFNEP